MFDYDISEKGLKKFRDNYLKLVDRSEKVYTYIYNYQGSTCRDGGAPFNSNFHITVEVGDTSVCFVEGWIELPTDNNPGALKMCGYTSEQFILRLKQPPNFCGKTIEDILKIPMKTNFAGCLCHEPMVNDKWRMVLSTVHYTLTNT